MRLLKITLNTIALLLTVFSNSHAQLPHFTVDNTTTLSGRLIFTAKEKDKDQIFLHNFQSGATQLLKLGDSEQFNNFSASISPNGFYLAFVSDRDGNKEIYLADWDGKNLKRLTTTSSEDTNPTWDSDSKTLYFNSQQGDKTNIFSINIHDGKISQLTNFDGANLLGSVSPDGTRISYSTNRFWPGWDICVMPLKGGNEKCILSGRPSFLDPQFSSDGKKLAFLSGESDTFQLSIYNFSEGFEDKNGATNSDERDPTWISNDSSILFSSKGSINFPEGIYILSMETGKTMRLVTDGKDIRHPQWSPLIDKDLQLLRVKMSQTDLIPIPNTPPEDYKPPYLR